MRDNLVEISIECVKKIAQIKIFAIKRCSKIIFLWCVTYCRPILPIYINLPSESGEF